MDVLLLRSKKCLCLYPLIQFKHIVMPFIDKRSWATSSDNISYSPHSREIERERGRERDMHYHLL